MSTLLLKNYINYILKENKEFTTKLHVFDFDDTLYKSPNETQEWKQKNPKSYWWDSGDSLNPYITKIDSSSLWINNIVDSAKESIADPNTLAVLCTARLDRPEIIYAVSNLLREKNLKFERMFFKPRKINISSPQYKAETVRMLLNAYPNIKEVSFWDDKMENLDAVANLIQNNPQRNISYFPNLPTNVQSI